MKKASLVVIAMVFVAGLGAAYAADNGITDFSGTVNDRLEIEHAAGTMTNVYESSAPGSKRLVEDFNATAKSYDTFDIGSRASAKPGMKRNWAASRPSYN